MNALKLNITSHAHFRCGVVLQNSTCVMNNIEASNDSIFFIFLYLFFFLLVGGGGVHSHHTPFGSAPRQP